MNKFKIFKNSFFLMLLITFSCAKDSNQSEGVRNSKVELRAPEPCEFYCDGEPNEIYLHAVNDGSNGCCYTFRYNGLGGWVTWGTPPSSHFIYFEGKEFVLYNHNCGGETVTYKTTIYNNEATICTEFPLDFPQVTINIRWFPPNDLPVIIGCVGFFIDVEGSNIPDPWRDNCN